MLARMGHMEYTLASVLGYQSFLIQILIGHWAFIKARQWSNMTGEGGGGGGGLKS